MKLKRGQKLCKNCNGINGARSHTCKHCSHEFHISKNKNPEKIKKKKKLKKYQSIDWKTLVKGDKIKVVGRSGNYYVNSNGDKQYLTDSGIYTIYSHDDNGLVVYGTNNGFGYIYMGLEQPSNLIPNMFRSPHKIYKVNIPERQTL